MCFAFTFGLAFALGCYVMLLCVRSWILPKKSLASATCGNGTVDLFDPLKRGSSARENRETRMMFTFNFSQIENKIKMILERSSF